jgi:hypothetical protein
MPRELKAASLGPSARTSPSLASLFWPCEESAALIRSRLRRHRRSLPREEFPSPAMPHCGGPRFLSASRDAELLEATSSDFLAGPGEAPR